MFITSGMSRTIKSIVPGIIKINTEDAKEEKEIKDQKRPRSLNSTLNNSLEGNAKKPTVDFTQKWRLTISPIKASYSLQNLKPVFNI